jgi:DNA-binding NarL/FixJ family response regulator
MVRNSEQNHPRVRVAVVDGYPFAREGLKAFLGAAPGFEVVGEAEDGDGAILLIGETTPELVVLGFQLAGRPNGVAVCRSVKALPKPPHVLALIGHNHAEAMLPFFLAGADSYLHRRSDRYMIVDAARRTAAGERIWDVAVGAEEATTILHSTTESAPLTARELEVLTLKHHRYTNAEIAETLNISLHTVKHHVSSIKRKLSRTRQAP